MRTWPVGEPRSILLLWIGRLGDVLIATPLFTALRRRFPEARITLVTAEAGAGAGALSPDVDELLVLRRFHRPLANLALAARLLRPSDLLVDLNSAFSRASWTLARLARARRKAAFAKGRGDRAWDWLLEAPSETEHMLDRYARLAAALGAPYEPRLRVRLGERDLAAADALLASSRAPAGPLIGVHPGNFKKFDNRWPEEKFIELTERLLRRGISTVYLAGPGEEGPVRRLVSRISRPPQVLGPLPIGPFSALLSRLDLLIVNATGTAHLACAVDTPTFSLRSRYVDTVWMPRAKDAHGARHYAAVSEEWESCRGISVDSAERALAEALAALPAAPRRASSSR